MGGEGAGTRAQEPSLWLSVEEPAGQQAEGGLCEQGALAQGRPLVVGSLAWVLRAVGGGPQEEPHKERLGPALDWLICTWLNRHYLVYNSMNSN